MARRPTVYDVAQRAGVSIATVSFAFRQPHRVKPTTLEAVLEAARALGYLPSASARGLATGRTGAIGLYSYDYLIDPPLPSARDAPGEADGRSFPLYVDEVQHGVELECRRLGFALMVGGARTAPSTPGLVDIAGRVDGLIVFPGSMEPAMITTVACRVPVVALGSDVSGAGVATVRVDDAGGMQRMVDHLVGVHQCRRLLFVGERQTAEIAARYDGFAAAVRQAGLAVPPPLPSRPGLDDTTIRAVRSYLQDGGAPDAFVCATDQEALVTQDVVIAAGLSVPHDVLVTGFDDVLAARLARPALTTVRQPMGRIGRTAVRLLATLMDGEGRAGANPELPVELVLRQSCGCRRSDAP